MPAAQNDRSGTDAPTVDMQARRVSVSRVIAADPQRLFDVVADPSMHHVIDGSGTVKGTRSTSRKLTLGDRFTTTMRLGVPYVMSNKVVELEEPRLIAWSHVGGWRWRYELEAVGDGTRVTETFDWSTVVGGPVGRAYVEKVGWPRKHVANMERTLERLDAFVTNKHQGV